MKKLYNQLLWNLLSPSLALAWNQGWIAATEDKKAEAFGEPPKSQNPYLEENPPTRFPN